ncbi:MAG: peptidase S9, partial [Bacteroidales bacterium]
MKKYFIAILVFAISVNLNAQNLPDRQAGKLTPELLWKLGRVSEMQISPDGKTILYGITYYSLEENKGNRDLYSIPVSGGNPTKLTDTKESEYNAVWRPDGKKIAYLSAQNGSMQIWEMNPDGSDKKQVSDIEDGINGFAYSPALNNILFIKDVKLDKTVNDIYTDLPK